MRSNMQAAAFVSYGGALGPRSVQQLRQVELGAIAREHLPKFEPWVRHWNRAVSRAYLQAYCERTRASALLPSNRTDAVTPTPD